MFFCEWFKFSKATSFLWTTLGILQGSYSRHGVRRKDTQHSCQKQQRLSDEGLRYVQDRNSKFRVTSYRAYMSTCTLERFKHNYLPVEAESCRFLTSLLLDESWQCSPEDPEIPPMMARILDTLEEVQTLPLPLP